MSDILTTSVLVAGSAIVAAGVGITVRYGLSRAQWSRERRQRQADNQQEVFARSIRVVDTTRQGTIVCPRCGCPQPCHYEDQSFSCRKCERTFDFVACSKCQTPQVHCRGFGGNCRNCSKSIRCSLFWDFLHLSNPGSFVSFAELIGPDPAAQPEDPQPGEPEETPRLVLRRLVVMNGAGWAPQIGRLARLLLFEDRIEISDHAEPSKPLSIPLTRLHDLRIEGRSLSKDEELLGGAVESMLAATVLNTSTRNQDSVTIDLIAGDGWVRLRLDGIDAVRVREDLGVLADAIIVRQSNGTPSSSETMQPEVNLVSTLEKLTQLRDEGALSDEEFLLAKEKLLRST